MISKNKIIESLHSDQLWLGKITMVLWIMLIFSLFFYNLII
jgi:hypothetical protein